jgi:hypothetical protein
MTDIGAPEKKQFGSHHMRVGEKPKPETRGQAETGAGRNPNDETQMTNECPNDQMPEWGARAYIWSFEHLVIDSSFGFRHSGFLRPRASVVGV